MTMMIHKVSAHLATEVPTLEFPIITGAMTALTVHISGLNSDSTRMRHLARAPVAAVFGRPTKRRV